MNNEKLYYYSVWALYLAFLADAATTHLADILHAGYEANPIAAWIQGLHPLFLIVASYVLAVGIAIVLYIIPEKAKRPGLIYKVWPLVLVPAAIHAYAAINNTLVILTGQGLPPIPLLVRGTP